MKGDCENCGEWTAFEYKDSGYRCPRCGTIHWPMDVEEFLDKGNWHWAKTFEKFAPHWYIRSHEEPEIYKFLKGQIKDHGVEEEFRIYRTVKTYRYLYIGGFKYWETDPSDTIIINKAKV